MNAPLLFMLFEFLAGILISLVDSIVFIIEFCICSIGAISSVV